MKDKKKKKETTYRFFIHDKEGNLVNIDTLTPEERKEVGIWAYQTMLRELGYVPVGPAEESETEEK